VDLALKLTVDLAFNSKNTEIIRNKSQ
jgi:hypothetical protein